MKNTIRLLPPQKVVGSEQIAPLQYSIKDTARLLALSKATIERMIRRGELASVGHGRLRRVPYDAIVMWLERNRNEAV